MTRLFDWIRAHATPPTVALTAAAWLLLSAGNGLLLARLRDTTTGLPIPDLQPPLRSPEQLYKLLEAYGEHGRRAYLDFTILRCAGRSAPVRSTAREG